MRWIFRMQANVVTAVMMITPMKLGNVPVDAELY